MYKAPFWHQESLPEIFLAQMGLKWGYSVQMIVFMKLQKFKENCMYVLIAAAF